MLTEPPVGSRLEAGSPPEWPEGEEAVNQSSGNTDVGLFTRLTPSLHLLMITSPAAPRLKLQPWLSAPAQTHLRSLKRREAALLPRHKSWGGISQHARHSRGVCDRRKPGRSGPAHDLAGFCGSLLRRPQPTATGSSSSSDGASSGSHCTELDALNPLGTVTPASPTSERRLTELGSAAGQPSKRPKSKTKQVLFDRFE